MRRMERKRRVGFTLIEVLLVAGILALLAAFAIPQLFKTAEEARIKLAEAAVKRNGPIASQLTKYRFDMGGLPDTDDGLAALFVREDRADDDRYQGPDLEGSYEELLDPWGNPFEYRSPGDVNEDSYDLWSRGPDGIDDGGKEGSDDVKNWIEK